MTDARAESAESTEIIARAVVVRGGRLLVARQVGDEWSFLPGGHARPGEPLASALRRELAEELGAVVTESEQIGTVEYAYSDADSGSHLEVNHVFDVTLAGADEELVSREAHLEFAWIPMEELAEARLRPEPLKHALKSWWWTGRPFCVGVPAGKAS
ncbi:NUDIX domain-containing protein [Bailinhaonella thermotolerans]|uniref:NUDIX domain-containing protein n=1 Tax=Bailinhaonella thermotolerans TaxID=1070861 RepID=UPI00192A1EF9|nr:NUDIX domain-containing protein [Bailinhaonella thermotolerans]